MSSIDQSKQTQRLPQAPPPSRAKLAHNGKSPRARVSSNGRLPATEPPHYGRPPQRQPRGRRGALFMLRYPLPRYRAALGPARRKGGFVRTAIAAVLSSVGLIAVLLLAGISGGALAAWQYFTYDLPSLADIHLIEFQSTKIYDRWGELLYEISDPSLGKRTYVEIDQLPRDLLNATIAAEDKTFYENRGIDYTGILRAVWINLSGQGSSGASTITMQLVRRVLLPEGDELSWRRKIREAILANQFTNEYSKDKILEIYLNDIYYGSLAYGVAAAADVYYGKSVRDLTLAEAAMLAGLPQAPSYYDPNINYDIAKRRQEYVLREMVDAGFIEDYEAEDAAAQDVRPINRAETAPIKAPHFVNYVREQLESMYGADLVNQGGLRVFTTIDLRYQELAQQVASAQIEALAAENASNAALMAMNPRTGEILAMLGSVDYNNPDFGQVNVATSLRQPGSAFKPLVYLTAFQQGMGPATLLADIPTEFSNGLGRPPYAPKNYDLRYRGPVLARRALANSLNVPTVELMERVDPSAVLANAKLLGITNLGDDPTQHGLALALGSAEVRLLELLNSYAAFANGGLRMPPVALLDVRDANGKILYHFDLERAQGVQAVGAAEAYLLTDILSDNNARLEVFGPNNSLQLSRKAAAKTGTTENYKDSWTMGYTPALAVGVWVGNNDGREMARIAGARGAGPIWHNFFEGVFADPELEKVLLQPGETEVPRDFVQPPDVVRVPVCALSGMKLGPGDTDIINELFIAAHPPAEVCNLHQLFKVDLSHPEPQLANEFCPPQFVVERPYVTLPARYDEWVQAQQDENKWLPPAVVCEVHGPTPAPSPTVYVSPTPVPAIVTTTVELAPAALPTMALASEYPGSNAGITSPRPGAALPPQVTIAGDAEGPDFDHYDLLYSSAADPFNWVTIPVQGLRPVRDSILGVWRTDGLAEGSYTLRLSVFGRAGQYRNVDVWVEIARSTPTIELLYPRDNASSYHEGDNVYIAANASGPQGVLGVEFYVDGERVASDTVAPYQYNWVATTGRHLIGAVAFSPAGHRAASGQVSIVVEPRPTPAPTHPPIFNLVSPHNGSVLKEQEVPLIVQTAVSGITRVDFYVDGHMIGTDPGTGLFQFPWQTSVGQHVLMAIGYDSNGMEMARSRVIVLVNP